MKSLQHNVATVAPCFALLLCSVRARATNLDVLTAQADAVILASGSTRIEESEGVHFSAKTVKSFKGPIVEGDAIELDWLRPLLPSLPVGTVDFGFRGLFFLKEMPGGTWAPIVALGGRLPLFVRLYYPAADPSGDPSTLGIETADQSLPSVLFRLVAAEIETRPDTYLTRVLDDAADGYDTAAVRGILRHVRDHAADPRERWRSAAALVRKNDVEALRWLAGHAGQNFDPYAVNAIADAISTFFRNPDAAATSLLVGIVQGSSFPLEWRAASVRSLRAVHSRESLPLFGSLIGDDNGAWQLDAAYAISSFVNGCPAQTVGDTAMSDLSPAIQSTYKTEDTIAHLTPSSIGAEKEFIAYWQSWWSKHSAQLSTQ